MREAPAPSIPTGAMGLKLAIVSVCIALCFLVLGRWSDPSAAPLDAFQRCDAGWYELIAENGYPEMGAGADLGHWKGSDIHQTEWAFFPLYPMTVRLAAKAIGVPTRTAMFMFAWLFTIALPVVAFRTFEALGTKGNAYWSVLGMLCFPFSIYFHAHMSEALFTLVLLGSFLAIAKRNVTLMIVCSSALVLSRPNGPAMLLPLLLFLLERDGKSFRIWREDPRYLLRVARLLVPSCLAYAAYGYYQWRMTGTPFAFHEAEEGWGRHLSLPFTGAFDGGDTATQFDSWYAIGVVIVTLLLRRRLTGALGVFIWISLLVPLVSGSVAGFPRYTCVMFPFFLLAGEWLTSSRWRYAVLGAALVLQFGWFWLWLGGDGITC